MASRRIQVGHEVRLRNPATPIDLGCQIIFSKGSGTIVAVVRNCEARAGGDGFRDPRVIRFLLPLIDQTMMGYWHNVRQSTHEHRSLSFDRGTIESVPAPRRFGCGSTPMMWQVWWFKTSMTTTCKQLQPSRPMSSALRGADGLP